MPRYQVLSPIRLAGEIVKPPAELELDGSVAACLVASGSLRELTAPSRATEQASAGDGDGAPASDPKPAEAPSDAAQGDQAEPAAPAEPEPEPVAPTEPEPEPVAEAKPKAGKGSGRGRKKK